MDKLEEIKSYFNKLKKVILNEAEFKFLNYELIKKERIDDILCCLLTVLPNKYKSIVKTIKHNKYPSMVKYNMLISAIKMKFSFNKNVYLVDQGAAIQHISGILMTIERDLRYLEKDGNE